MRRRRALVVTTLLAGALSIIDSAPAAATTTSVATEAQYRAALTALSADNSGPHTIRLTADITVDDGTDPTYTGTQALTVDGDGHTLDADGTSRVLLVPTGLGTSHVITLRDLTVTGGHTTSSGGGIRATNALVRVEHSTLVDNHSTFGTGGAVDAGGGVPVVVNSTLHGNTASSGGALAGGGVALVHATITGNSGPQVVSAGNLDPFASVIADPDGGANCSVSGLVNSSGHNWSTDTSCGLTGTGDTQDGEDPLLGLLQDNGGPTPTRYPALTSPLVNAVPNGSCSGTTTTDQRGVARPFPAAGACDIGAVERTPLGPAFVVSDEAEYRAALVEASWYPQAPQTITLDADLTLDDGTDPTYTGDQALTLDGAGHTIDAAGTSRGLLVDSVTNATIQHATIQNGYATATSHAFIRGAAVSTRGALTVTDSTITGNAAVGNGSGDFLQGGGIYAFGPVTVADSTITANSATSNGTTGDAGGGGVFSLGPVTVTNSTVTGNTATTNGASALGGGIHTGSALTVTDSTVAGNTAAGISQSQGGGLFAYGVTITGSTVRDNTATVNSTFGFSRGGGLSSHGATSVDSSAVIGNAATSGGPGVGRGGGLASSGVVTLVNSTIATNRATAGSSQGGGLFTESTGGVDLSHSTVVENDAGTGANLFLVAGSSASASGSVVSGCSLGGGTMISGGGNWSPDTSCGLPDVEEHVGEDPLVGPVRDNGGTTPTLFPLWASPLRDQIPAGDCSVTLTADQRGVARPYPTGGSCDVGAVEAVYPPHAFGDVPGWVDTAVRWITSTVNDPPLMTGITPSVFDPNANITRAQFARLLYREAGAPDVTALPPHGFTDVPAWVDDAVRWAKANNVMTGITPTLFKPNDPITRAQVARAKYRFAGEQDTTGFGGHPFTDVPAWVETAIDWTWQHQLMTGITPTTFKPNDPITRAQVARLDERLGLSPWAWNDPTTAPNTLPFRPHSG